MNDVIGFLPFNFKTFNHLKDWLEHRQANKWQYGTRIEIVAMYFVAKLAISGPCVGILVLYHWPCVLLYFYLWWNQFRVGKWKKESKMIHKTWIVTAMLWRLKSDPAHTIFDILPLLKSMTTFNNCNFCTGPFTKWCELDHFLYISKLTNCERYSHNYF